LEILTFEEELFALAKIIQCGAGQHRGPMNVWPDALVGPENVGKPKSGIILGHYLF
jgi:hypothetical protein